MSSTRYTHYEIMYNGPTRIFTVCLNIRRRPRMLVCRNLGVWHSCLTICSTANASRRQENQASKKEEVGAQSTELADTLLSGR